MLQLSRAVEPLSSDHLKVPPVGPVPSRAPNPTNQCARSCMITCGPEAGYALSS